MACTASLQGSSKFTREELRDLFQLNEKTDCDTRDLLAALPSGAEWQVSSSYIIISRVDKRIVLKGGATTGSQIAS